MNLGHINPSSPSIDVKEYNQKQSSTKTDLLCYIFSSAIWAATVGIAASQAFNKTEDWPKRCISVILSINWLILPFKFQAKLNDRSENLCQKINRIGSKEIGAIIGFSTAFFIGCFLQSEKRSFSAANKYSFEIGLIITNLFACYILKNITPVLSNRSQLIVFVKEIFHSIIRRSMSAFNHLSEKKPTIGETQQKSLEDELEKSTINLKKENQFIEENFQMIINFVKSDSELLNKFNESFKETESILLPPAKIPNSELLSNPIVEEWKQESLKFNYFYKLKTRFIDFLDKNPEFKNLFIKKVKEKNQFFNIKKFLK